MKTNDYGEGHMAVTHAILSILYFDITDEDTKETDGTMLKRGLDSYRIGLYNDVYE